MPRPHNVFITGASSGIGEALAREYAARGATVGLFARRQAALDALVAAMPAGRAAAYAGDVRDAGALAGAAADFIARFGTPDVVIANAGISRGVLTGQAEDLAAFRAVFDTNVVGLVHTFAPFLAAMNGAGQGALVGVASIAGFRGLPGSGAYSASKAAAISYLESLRVEQRGTGVAVLTVCPGYIATPMTAQNPYPMPFLLDASGGGAAHRPRHRPAPVFLRAALADGDRRALDANASAARLRCAVRARAAQAAAIALSGRPGAYSGIRSPTVTAQ